MEERQLTKKVKSTLALPLHKGNMECFSPDISAHGRINALD